jgi:thymidylate kinase
VATTSAEAPLAAALDLARALAARGIRFVHWKSNGHLAEALSGATDIDMFADPAQRDEVRACLRQQNCLEIISQPWGSYPDVEDWLAMDEATGRFLHIHLHFALVTGLRRVKHLRLPWGEALLAHCDHALDPVWPTPTAEMELMILIVRMWAKMPPAGRTATPRLPAHVRAELDWLLSRADAARLKALAGELLPGFDTEAVAALVSAPPPSDAAVLAVSRAVYGALKDHHRMPWAAARMRGATLNLRAAAAKQLRKVRPATVTGKRAAGRGLVVAFIGSDGSGKSTLTAEIRKWLRYKLDVHGYYMGSGEGSTRLLDRLRHAVKGRAGKQTQKAPKTADAARPRKQRGILDRLVALHQLPAIGAKRRDLVEARRLAAAGSMVVLDRFPQAEVNGIYDGPRLQDGNSFAWAARAERRGYASLAGHMPDLVIKLVVSPEVAHARKPDHSLATIARKCALTRQLAFDGAAVVAIDADQPLDKVMLDAKRAVWRHILKAADAPR